MTIAEELAKRFVCAKCKATGGTVKSAATNNTSWGGLFGFPSPALLGVSCRHCGYTDLFDADALTKNRNGGAIFDTIYGKQPT